MAASQTVWITFNLIFRSQSNSQGKLTTWLIFQSGQAVLCVQRLCGVGCKGCIALVVVVGIFENKDYSGRLGRKIRLNLARWQPVECFCCPWVLQAESKYQLVRAECVRCPWAAGRNVGGHYKGHFLSLSLFSLSGSLLILREGVVVGFRNFAWAPN